MKNIFLDSVRSLFFKYLAICAGTVMICMSMVLFLSPDLGPGFLDYELSVLFLLPVYILCYIMPVVLVYDRFGFLHDRVRRDFYESAPVSRSRRFAAEYTSVCIITIIAVSISFWPVMAFMRHCHFWVFGGALRIYVSMLLISLVMCALSVIAVSLSGRLSTSLVLLAALTIALPEALKICWEFYMRFGKYVLYTPSVSFIPPLFYNTLTGFFRIFSLGANRCWGTVFTDSSLIITALSCVVLFAAAYLAFVKSRVNTGDSFCRPALGHVCAALLALPGMIVVTEIIAGSIWHYNYTRLGMRTAIILSRILLFFLIERICLGRSKRLYRTLPVLAVCFAAAAGICAGLFAYSKAVSAMPRDPEYIIVKRLDYNNRYYSERQRSETESKGLLPNYRITDKKLIDEIINYKGNDWNFDISYEVHAGKKHAEKFGIISKELVLRIQAELEKAPLEFIPRENIKYIGYYGDYYFDDQASEGCYGSKLFDATAQKKRLLDCFYEEYEMLSNEQKAEIASEGIASPMGSDFLICTKNGEVLRFHLDAESFPKTAQVLYEIMEKELNDYARDGAEYKISVKY